MTRGSAPRDTFRARTEGAVTFVLIASLLVPSSAPRLPAVPPSVPGSVGEVDTGVCDSCGRDDEPVVLVRRLYVTPESWDTPGRVDEGERERWCFVCRTHYPHRVEDDDGEPAPPA
jgi:hypothetical protein